jgi:hypothetical protein
MFICDMLVAGQRMADQDGVGFAGIELAISLVSDLKRREIDAAIKPQRLIAGEHRDLRGRMVCLLSSILGVSRARYRLRVYHPDTTFPAVSRNRQTTGHKKPA